MSNYRLYELQDFGDDYHGSNSSFRSTGTPKRVTERSRSNESRLQINRARSSPRRDISGAPISRSHSLGQSDASSDQPQSIKSDVHFAKKSLKAMKQGKKKQGDDKRAQDRSRKQARMQREIDDLQELVSKLRRENREQKRQISNLTKENTRLETKVKNLTGEVQLQKSISSIQKKDLLAAHRNTMKISQENSKDFRRSLQQLQFQLKKIEGQEQRARRLYSKDKRQILDTDRKNSFLKQKLESAIARLNQLDSEKGGPSGVHVNENELEQIKRLSQMITQETERNAQRLKQLETFTQSVKMSMDSEENLKKQKMQLENELKLRQKLTDVEIQRLKESQEKTANLIKSEMERIYEIERAKSRIRNQMKYEHKGSRINILEQQIKDMENQLNSARSTVAQLETKHENEKLSLQQGLAEMHQSDKEHRRRISQIDDMKMMITNEKEDKQNLLAVFEEASETERTVAEEALTTILAELEAGKEQLARSLQLNEGLKDQLNDSRTKAEQMSEKILSLEEEVERKSQIDHEAEKEAQRQLELEIKGLQEALNAERIKENKHRAEYERTLSLEREKANGEVQRLTKKMQEEKERAEKALQERESAIAERQRALEERRRALEDKEQFEQESTKLKRANTTIQQMSSNELEDMKIRLDMVTKKLEQEKSQNEKLQANMLTLQSNNDNFSKLLMESTARETESLKRISELSNEMVSSKKLPDDWKELRATNDKFEHEVSLLKQRLASTEAERSSLATALGQKSADLISSKAGMTMEIETLTKSKRTLQQNVKELEDKLEKSEKELMEVKGELSETQDQLDETIIRHAMMSGDLESDAEKTQKELSETQKMLEKYKQRIIDMEKDSKKVAAVKQVQAATALSLQEDSVALRTETETRIAGLQDEVKSLKSLLEEANGRDEENIKKVCALSSEIAKLKSVTKSAVALTRGGGLKMDDRALLVDAHNVAFELDPSELGWLAHILKPWVKKIEEPKLREKILSQAFLFHTWIPYFSPMHFPVLLHAYLLLEKSNQGFTVKSVEELSIGIQTRLMIRKRLGWLLADVERIVMAHDDNDDAEFKIARGDMSKALALVTTNDMADHGKITSEIFCFLAGDDEVVTAEGKEQEVEIDATQLIWVVRLLNAEKLSMESTDDGIFDMVKLRPDMDLVNLIGSLAWTGTGELPKREVLKMLGFLRNGEDFHSRIQARPGAKEPSSPRGKRLVTCLTGASRLQIEAIIRKCPGALWKILSTKGVFDYNVTKDSLENLPFISKGGQQTPPLRAASPGPFQHLAVAGQSLRSLEPDFDVRSIGSSHMSFQLSQAAMSDFWDIADLTDKLKSSNDISQTGGKTIVQDLVQRVGRLKDELGIRDDISVYDGPEAPGANFRKEVEDQRKGLGFLDQKENAENEEKQMFSEEQLTKMIHDRNCRIWDSLESKTGKRDEKTPKTSSWLPRLPVIIRILDNSNENLQLLEEILELLLSIFQDYSKKEWKGILVDEIQSVGEKFAFTWIQLWSYFWGSFCSCAKVLIFDSDFNVFVSRLRTLIQLSDLLVELSSQVIPPFFIDTRDQWLPVFVEIMEIPLCVSQKKLVAKRNSKTNSITSGNTQWLELASVLQRVTGNQPAEKTDSANRDLIRLKMNVVKIATAMLLRGRLDGASHIKMFVDDNIKMVSECTSEPMYDHLVIGLMGFLSAVLLRCPSYIGRSDNAMRWVVIPNLVPTPSDFNRFIKQPDVYMEYDVGQSAGHSRRRATLSFLMDLSGRNPNIVRHIISIWIKDRVKRMESNKNSSPRTGGKRKKRWKSQDRAALIYICTYLDNTQVLDVPTNLLIGVVSMTLDKKKSKDDVRHKLLIADAIKFAAACADKIPITSFKNILFKLFRVLGSGTDFIHRMYAALAVSRMLQVKDDDHYRYPDVDLEPLVSKLFNVLFGLLVKNPTTRFKYLIMEVIRGTIERCEGPLLKAQSRAVSSMLLKTASRSFPEESDISAQELESSGSQDKPPSITRSSSGRKRSVKKRNSGLEQLSLLKITGDDKDLSLKGQQKFSSRLWAVCGTMLNLIRTIPDDYHKLSSELFTISQRILTDGRFREFWPDVLKFLCTMLDSSEDNLSPLAAKAYLGVCSSVLDKSYWTHMRSVPMLTGLLERCFCQGVFNDAPKDTIEKVSVLVQHLLVSQTEHGSGMSIQTQAFYIVNAAVQFLPQRFASYLSDILSTAMFLLAKQRVRTPAYPLIYYSLFLQRFGFDLVSNQLPMATIEKLLDVILSDPSSWLPSDETHQKVLFLGIATTITDYSFVRNRNFQNQWADLIKRLFFLAVIPPRDASQIPEIHAVLLRDPYPKVTDLFEFLSGLLHKLVTTLVDDLPAKRQSTTIHRSIVATQK